MPTRTTVRERTYLAVHEENEVSKPHLPVLVGVEPVHQVLDLPPHEVLLGIDRVRRETDEVGYSHQRTASDFVLCSSSDCGAVICSLFPCIA